MPRLRDGETQENISLPIEVVRQVEDYRFERRLPSKKDAYRELIEKGLAKSKEEAPQK